MRGDELTHRRNLKNKQKQTIQANPSYVATRNGRKARVNATAK
jgi:hypothetical protein